MTRLYTTLLFFVLAACGGITPPPDPPATIFPLSFVVCSTNPCNGHYVSGASIQFVEGNRPTLTTNEYGYADTTTGKSTYTITITAEGYHDSTFSLTVDRRMNRDVTLLAIVPPLSRIRTDGRFYVTDDGTFRPLWVSGLTFLKKSEHDQLAFLRWMTDTGMNGLRVFAGALPWAAQTVQDARSALPAAFARALAAGVYVYVVANTESRTGYDVVEHTTAIANMCAEAVNCVLEGANEYWHPTQSDQVQDVAWLQNMLLRVVPPNVTWSTGAASVDEGADYPAQAGTFSTAHLDRSRDKWNQVRRIREIFGIAEGTGKPAMSGEPIGAAEASQPGRRESDPNFFFALGALCRLFEVGCVFHSEQGLDAVPHTGNQQVCAQAYVDGFKSLDTADRLTYKNAGWSDSPVKSFTGAVRVYSGVVGDRGYSVVVGAESGLRIEWQNNWSPRETITDRGEVKVYRIGR